MTEAESRRQGGLENMRTGENFEREVVAKVQRKMFWASRTAGSRGLFDIIAKSKNGKSILISCKFNGYWTPKERDELRAYKKAEWEEVWVAYREAGKTVVGELN